MAIRESPRWCPGCRRVTRHEKRVFSGGMGCLLTFLTGGLFLPVWLLLVLVDAASPYYCAVCGRPEAGRPSRGRFAQTCPTCGARLPAEARFCRDCGRPLSGPASPPPAPGAGA